MKKRITWVTLSLLMVVALVLSSCQAATVEEEEAETVTGKVTETEAAVVDEEEEAVVEEEGPVMVRDVKGRLVEKPQYGGTITVYQLQDPVAWDPWRNSAGTPQYLVMGAIFEKLVGGDWSVDRSENDFTSAYVPLRYSKGYSMKSWENPDPLTYIIHLREGMHFQNRAPVNGREVIADDVKWSCDRILGKGDFAEAGPSPYVIFAAWSVVDRIEAVDKYTLTIHLKEASPLFPEHWGTELMPFIQPREVVEQYGDNFSWKQAIGSGPFQIADFVSGSSVTFEKHPNYYGWDENFPDNQIPYIDKYKVLIMADESTQMAALRTGKIDIKATDWMNGASLMESNPELKWIKTRGICRSLTIRNDLEPWSDIKVRKAMQMAIDLKMINDEYYGGTGDPFPMMVTAGWPVYHTPLEQLPEDCREGFIYNPERARELLTEAGYPSGFQQTLTLSSAASVEEQELSDIFIAFWEDIGIETEIEVLESAAFYSYKIGRKHEMTWFMSCGFWMPTEILNYWYGGTKVSWNYANVDDPIFNKMLDDIRANADASERDRMLKEAFAYGTSQFFVINAPATVGYRFWQPWLKGYRGEGVLQATSPPSIYARIWIDEDLKKEMGH